MFKGFIYCITCLTNGKMYIGQTSKTIEERFQSHIHKAEIGKNYALYRAIRKYGPENFTIEEVMFVEAPTKEELKQKLDYLERRFIAWYDTLRHGYNMTIGGDGSIGLSWSKESRKKLGKSLKGRKFTEEHRKKISEAKRGKKRPPLSDEWKRKIGESCKGHRAPYKGVKLTEERKEKIRQGTIKAYKEGRKVAPILRGEKNPFYGKHHSKESRMKMKESWKLRKSLNYGTILHHNSWLQC